MIKITAQTLSEHVGITVHGVNQWFKNNGRSLNSLDDVVDFVTYHRIKGGKGMTYKLTADKDKGLIRMEFASGRFTEFKVDPSKLK